MGPPLASVAALVASRGGWPGRPALRNFNAPALDVNTALMRLAALSERARYGHSTEGERMTGVQILAAVLTLGLLVYLTIALLKPEQFQ